MIPVMVPVYGGPMTPEGAKMFLAIFIVMWSIAGILWLMGLFAGKRIDMIEEGLGGVAGFARAFFILFSSIAIIVFLASQLVKFF